jgi:hypothetical protein
MKNKILRMTKAQEQTLKCQQEKGWYFEKINQDGSVEIIKPSRSDIVPDYSAYIRTDGTIR